jgi:hypothetical protein
MSSRLLQSSAFLPTIVTPQTGQDRSARGFRFGMGAKCRCWAPHSIRVFHLREPPGTADGLTKVQERVVDWTLLLGVARRTTMRKIALGTIAALAVVAAGSLQANRAEAMTLVAPAGLANAAAGTAITQEARWVCGRYRCWWRPGPYYGGRPWGWRRWGWHRWAWHRRW